MFRKVFLSGVCCQCSALRKEEWMQIDRKEPIPGESPGAGGEAMKSVFVEIARWSSKYLM